MSLIQEYTRINHQREALEKQLKALQENPRLQAELEFKEKLSALMQEFDKSAKDVIALLNPQGEARKDAASPNRRKRKLKIYKNPATGEVVETRGGNHKTLKAWKDANGNDTVESWLIEERHDD